MKVNGTILLYNMTPERERQIMPIAISNGVRVKKVPPGDYGRKLGALAGREGYESEESPGEEEGFNDEMMVMIDFDSATFNQFLNDFRKYKVKSVALKAVLTETNAQWNSAELHRQIREEHDALSR